MTSATRTLATVTLAASALIGGLHATPSIAQACAVDHGPALHHHRRPAVRTAHSNAQHPFLKQVSCLDCTQMHLMRLSAEHSNRHDAAVLRSVEALLAHRAGQRPILIDLVHLMR